MFQYFLRRILLTIPTFIGCTLVVFFIIQMAPGGPYEQQLNALKKGGAEGGSNSDIGGQSLPQSALEELKRYYSVDQPVYIRYLIWLGVWQRESESFNVKPNERRLVGNGKSLMLIPDGNGYKIVDADNTTQVAEGWMWEDKTFDDGTKKTRIYRKEFSGILTGDFGKSYQYRKSVGTLIIERMPISIQFGVIGFIISYVVCVYLGIQKALRHNSKFDIASSTTVFLAYSIPGWALGLVLLVILSSATFKLEWFPMGGFEDKTYDSMSIIEKIVDRAWHFVLPIVAYTIGGFATLTMLMKNSLLDNLSQDYVRTAFAKGIRETRVVWYHAMRNSIIPVVANIGYVIGILLAGNYLIERTFNIPGIGYLTFDALLYRDYPILFGYTVITVTITLVGSVISDLCLALVDPRIRFK